MNALLPEGPLLAAFTGASLVLALTPGPAVLYIVARCLAQGRRCGFVSVAGVALGNLGNALGAALGLAALFAVSSGAFTVVKWAGAFYLVWLGVHALREKASGEPAEQASGEPAEQARAAALRQAFRDGFWVALLNPKTALFFAAFLPQFVAADASPLQSVALGALFVAIAASTDLCYVAVAGWLAPLLGRARQARSIGRYLSAGTYIGLGVFTALSGSRK